MHFVLHPVHLHGVYLQLYMWTIYLFLGLLRRSFICRGYTAKKHKNCHGNGLCEIVDCMTLEDGVGNLSHNFRNYQPTLHYYTTSEVWNLTLFFMATKFWCVFRTTYAVQLTTYSYKRFYRNGRCKKVACKTRKRVHVENSGFKSPINNEELCKCTIGSRWLSTRQHSVYSP
jgi:hypothetical protein